MEPIYAAILIDAVVVKVRDGQVRNQPYYAAIGVDLDGHNDLSGGPGPVAVTGGSAKFWFACLTELKNRGVKDVFFVVYDRPLGFAGQYRAGVSCGEGPNLFDPSAAQQLQLRS